MRTKPSEDAEIGFQITPMVDIVSLLIMFFMCSASSIKQETQIGITLPGGGTSESVADIEVYIGITTDGAVTFNETPIGQPNDTRLPELRAKLQSITKKFGTKIPVFIQPEAGALHQRVVDVLDACASSGIKNLSFSEIQG